MAEMDQGLKWLIDARRDDLIAQALPGAVAKLRQLFLCPDVKTLRRSTAPPRRPTPTAPLPSTVTAARCASSAWPPAAAPR